MSSAYLLPTLSSKREVDEVIKTTEDLVLVLRFGRENDSSCIQLDDVVSRLGLHIACWITTPVHCPAIYVIIAGN